MRWLSHPDRWLDRRLARPLDSRLIAALAYFLGIIGAAFLLVYGRQDRFVRLHALQSIAFSLTSGAALATPLMMHQIPIAFAIGLSCFGIWVLLMAHAWLGRPFQLPLIGGWAARRLREDD